MKVNTKQEATNERNHLFLFKKHVNKNSGKEKQWTCRWEKMKLGKTRKEIGSYDKKTFMRVQFILEIYVHRRI